MIDTSPELAPAFSDPVGSAQICFRSILNAMSRPGTIETLDQLPETSLPVSQAAIATALTLMDTDTPYWLPDEEAYKNLRAYLAFHTSAPYTAIMEQAQFAIIPDGVAIPDLSILKAGSPEYPDQSATLIIEAGQFGEGTSVELSGPGIKSTTSFSASKLTESFWQSARENNKRFPLGVDFIFTSSNSLAAMPRSTAIRM